MFFILKVIAGLLCLANSLFGFYSSYKEVKSLLVVYLAVSILLLTVLVMGGVMAYVFRHQIELNMKSQLMSDLRLYDPGNSESGVSLSWDRTQSSLQCCGIKTVQVLFLSPLLFPEFYSPQVDHSWQIWKYNTRVNPEVGEEILVPASCCLTDTPCVINNQTVVENVWPDDCYHKVS